jgi:hypothetical protein
MALDDEVVIRLTRAKAIAFFEWAQRFMETHNPQFTHPADAIVVDTLASELEWLLPEVFTQEYPRLLESSRAKVVSEYGDFAYLPDGSNWLGKLTYQDVQPQNDEHVSQ